LFLSFHNLVMVLPDHFRGMMAQRNSTETQQSDHASRSGPDLSRDTPQWLEWIRSFHNLVGKVVNVRDTYAGGPEFKSRADQIW